MCPASPGGDAPPHFLCLRQRKRAAPGPKEKRLGAKRHFVPFLLEYGGPNKRLPCKISVEALGAGPALLNLSVVSPRPGIAKPGYKTDLTCFSFRCRCRSLSPGGESKGEGPQPLPFEPFQGGVGETGEAPPAADEASLFRGSGAIGGPEKGPGIAMPRRC